MEEQIFSKGMEATLKFLSNFVGNILTWLEMEASETGLELEHQSQF